MGFSDDRGGATYATIVDGLLRIKATEGAKLGTKEAEMRVYKDRDGNEKQKWEFVFTSYTGFITDIYVEESDFGKQLRVVLEDQGTKVILSMPNTSNYAYSFLKCAYDVDFSKDVKVGSWSFEKDGKTKKGLTLSQDGKKIPTYFYEESTGWINGWPEPEGRDNMDNDDWKDYFGVTVRKFLYAFLESNILPKLKEQSEDILADVELPVTEPDDEMPADIEFPPSGEKLDGLPF